MPAIPGTLQDLRGPVTDEVEPVIEAVALPNDARIAVTIQLVCEAWSGRSTSGGPLGTAISAEAKAKGIPDYAAISDQHYAPRTGIWRLLETMKEYGGRASVTLSGLAAERWPEVARAIVDGGHEIVGHAYEQDRAMSDMDEEEDFEVVSKCAAILEEVSGQRPVGWSSQGSRRGTYTVLSLLRQDYLYTNDFRDADTPYVVAWLGEHRLIAMPRSDQMNDAFLIRRHGNPPSAYVEFFKRSFDQLYKEGARHPTVLSFLGHSQLMGRAWGAGALGECLEYTRQFDGVWQATRREVAEHYLKVLKG